MSKPKARTLTLTEAELREHLPGFAEMCDELDAEHARVESLSPRALELELAARGYLDTICGMTTHDFSRGLDREARLRLVRALGLTESDYSL